MNAPSVGVDIGNSTIKVHELPPMAYSAGFEPRVAWVTSCRSEIVAGRSVADVMRRLRQSFSTTHRFHVVTVVPDIGRALVDALRENADTVTYWGVESPFPATSVYAAGTRPGDDRMLAGMAAAWLVGPADAIVVDAGTAVTVDVMDGTGRFQGGAITPGFHLMSSSLAAGAVELPEAEWDDQARFPGRSTRECLAIGLRTGFQAGIRRLIEDAWKFAPGAKLVVTGGGAGALTTALADLPHVHCPELMKIGFALLEHRHAGSVG